MWHLCSFVEHDRWTVITFRKFDQRRRISGYETIYYNQNKPDLTHVSMVAQRKGDPKLIEVAEAAVAYVRLMDEEIHPGTEFKFKVRRI